MTESGISWGEEQWERVRGVVHDEAMRARVAASFLPLYGPLPPGAETVPANRLDYVTESSPPPAERMQVRDFDTLRLMTVAVNVYLKSHMVADPELAAALIMFRRAADVIARLEDAIVFNGKDAAASPPIEGVGGVRDVYTVSGGDRYDGLRSFCRPVPGDPASGPVIVQGGGGPEVFEAVVKAVNRLEDAGHHAPYACVLGDALFTAINRPMQNSMVLPRDSIPPFLDGPLLRSSTLPREAGLVVSLQGEPAEIVMPGDISVRHLQTTLDARHVFRVSERFVLRVKEPGAIVALQT